MKNLHTIAVIGGTGKAGSYLTRLLAETETPSKILVRDPKKITNQSFLEYIQGDVSHYNSVLQLLSGCQTVISCLGLGKPASDPAIFSTATKHILEAMKTSGISRYIVLAGLNVDTPADKKSERNQLATQWMKANYPLACEHRQQEYRLLAQSGINYTLVRVPLIEQTDVQQEVITDLYDCKGEGIYAASLARFLLGQVTDHRFLRKAPFVWNH